ncbi:MAG: DoxX family protein [Cyclobacteriaceae bacterium]
MKRDKIIYWITTGLLAAGMVMSGAMYLSKNEEMVTNFTAIGYPVFMLGILGVAKLLGGIALVAPVPGQLKEWVYAGFTFVFIGAAWTHVATATPWIAPVIALGILAVSYFFYLRIKTKAK